MVDNALVFPVLPSQAYRGAPVYLEPILGSGERLTVAVGVVGNDQAMVRLMIRSTVVRAMYGEKARNFIGLAIIIQKSLKEHLQKWKSFDAWNPPFSGARLGDVRDLLADDIEGAVWQLSTLHASLAPVKEVSETEDRPHLKESDMWWWRDVRKAVTERLPRLNDQFDVNIDGRVTGYRFKLGFLDSRFAAHFGLARTDRIHADSRTLKAKLWELQSVREGNYAQEAGLVLCMPQSKPSAWGKSKQYQDVCHLIQGLQAEAAERSLSFYRVQTPLEAANVVMARLAA